MIEFLVELLFEFVLGPIVEILLHGIGWLLKKSALATGRAASWVVKTRVAVDAILVFVSAGLGGGWGRYVAGTGQDYPPLALASLGVTAILAAGFAARSEPKAESDPSVDAVPSKRSYWSFDRARWTRLALLNLSGAAGVAIGYFA